MCVPFAVHFICLDLILAQSKNCEDTLYFSDHFDNSSFLSPIGNQLWNRPQSMLFY
jgi:hypothetical protein